MNKPESKQINPAFKLLLEFVGSMAKAEKHTEKNMKEKEAGSEKSADTEIRSV
ncbi:MAG: hypothetical protein QW835_07855 [Candidatus Hadarchaeum sp.]